MGARFADNFVGQLPSKVILRSFLVWSALDRVLQLVQEHVEVLLNVHLLDNVHCISLPVFKRLTVGFRVDMHLFRQLQRSKQILPLKEEVIILGIFVVVRVLDRENVVPEARNHKQLLINRVHVADAAQVLDTNIASR